MQNTQTHEGTSAYFTCRNLFFTSRHMRSCWLWRAATTTPNIEQATTSNVDGNNDDPVDKKKNDSSNANKCHVRNKQRHGGAWRVALTDGWMTIGPKHLIWLQKRFQIYLKKILKVAIIIEFDIICTDDWIERLWIIHAISTTRCVIKVKIIIWNNVDI